MKRLKKDSPALPALSGMRLRGLIEILHRNKYQVDNRCLGRLGILFLLGMVNSYFARFENICSVPKVRAEQIRVPPLFIIGHFRSGTTHLHNLLSRDENFVCPTAYQCMFPHHFHYSKKRGIGLFDLIAPKQRPMDALPFNSMVPYEDEFALAALSGISPYFRFLFPVARNDRYAALDPQRLPHEALERWKKALRYFVKSVIFWKDKGRIVLKSPPHTGRVRTLLEVFPGAKFVHLIRDPYVVYQSTRKLWKDALCRVHLQIPDPETVDEIILSWYTELFSLFERDRHLIPKDALHEMKFEDLERMPVQSIERLYKDLSLPGFDRFKEKAYQHLESTRGYRKNIYHLDAVSREKVRIRWRNTFDRYGYRP